MQRHPSSDFPDIVCESPRSFHFVAWCSGIVTYLLTYLRTYVLTYAFSLAGSIGHRPRNATIFCQWPSSPFISWCIPYLCFFFRDSLPGVSCPTSSPLTGSGLTGDGFCWFPGCMSYPPAFPLLFSFFYW